MRVPIVGLCDSAVIMAVVGDMLNAVSTFGPSLASLFVDTDSTKKHTNSTSLRHVTRDDSNANSAFVISEHSLCQNNQSRHRPTTKICINKLKKKLLTETEKPQKTALCISHWKYSNL